MPEALSKLERRILNYLVEYLREHTYQPSIREIGKRFGIKSTKTVSEHLQALARKGHIERDGSRSRAVRIVGLNISPAVVRVPAYGKVAPGGTALAREDVREVFELDRKLGGSGDAFFLEARGDAMRGLGIEDGDLVLVEPADAGDLRDGEIVAARIAGNATIKRYTARDGQAVLESDGAGFAPILVDEQSDFVLLGRVSGLFRRFTRASEDAPATAPAEAVPA